MTDFYVRSGAGGAGTGADWANAFLTISAALSGRANSDRIFVSEDHNETTASPVNWACPTTPGLQIICASHSGSVPPASADLATTGAAACTGTGALMTITGYALIKGLQISLATGSTGNPSLTIGSTTVGVGITLEDCKLIAVATAAGLLFVLGATSTALLEQRVRLRNTTFKFAAAGQAIKVASGRHSWSSTASAIDAGGTIPTTLFTSNTVRGCGSFEVVGVDLSGLGSGKTLVNLAMGGAFAFDFYNCKLGASVTKTTGTIGGPGGPRVRFHNCDSGATNNTIEEYDYAGSIVNENTIVRTGAGTDGAAGASDGTTAQTWKMVSNASAKFVEPLVSPIIPIWVDGNGGSKTVTIDIVTDNVTLKNDEIWMTLEYLGSALTPLGTIDSSNRKADILATGANQTTSTVAWTTSGLGTPVKQKLSATVTPNLKGYFKARVFLAKASTTVYVDPKAQVA